MTAKNEQAVVCEGVTKQFGAGDRAVRALRGIDLQVRFGELTLLEGPSGCGKTTLLSIIAGLFRPSSGEVTVFGTRLSRLSGGRLVSFRRENLGFVFQQHHLLPALTAAENAAVPAIISGLSRRKAIARGRDFLNRVNLGHRHDALPATLSGGEQQRVAIARALVHEPRLVLCDEPTASLDGANGEMIMTLLADVAVGSERAVIVVTHDPRVRAFGDRVASMEDGRIKEMREGDKQRGQRQDEEHAA